MSNKQEPLLPLKTISIKSWSEKLVDYAQTPEAKTEIDYWKTINRKPVSSLPVDINVSDNTVDSIDIVYMSLSRDETRRLITEVSTALNTNINDVLLLALAQAISEWGQTDSLYVDLEGHGREAILKGIDPSRTVGWFTSIYPVMIKLPEQTDIRQQLENVAMQYQLIPNHGIGFGILRYLNTNQETRQVLEDLPRPEISFLYMGQFDQPFSAEGLLTPASESIGPAHDPKAKRPYLLELNSIIEQGKFQISWSFSQNYHYRESIELVASLFMNSLRDIINQAKENTSDGSTESAFSSHDISDNDLAEILRQQGT